MFQCPKWLGMTPSYNTVPLEIEQQLDKMLAIYRQQEHVGEVTIHRPTRSLIIHWCKQLSPYSHVVDSLAALRKLRDTHNAMLICLQFRELTPTDIIAEKMKYKGTTIFKGIPEIIGVYLNNSGPGTSKVNIAYCDFPWSQHTVDKIRTALPNVYNRYIDLLEVDRSCMALKNYVIMKMEDHRGDFMLAGFKFRDAKYSEYDTKNVTLYFRLSVNYESLETPAINRLEEKVKSVLHREAWPHIKIYLVEK